MNQIIIMKIVILSTFIVIRSNFHIILISLTTIENDSVSVCFTHKFMQVINLISVLERVFFYESKLNIK